MQIGNTHEIYLHSESARIPGSHLILAVLEAVGLIANEEIAGFLSLVEPPDVGAEALIAENENVEEGGFNKAVNVLLYGLRQAGDTTCG